MKYIKTTKLTAHEAITLEHHGYVILLKDFGQMLWEVYKNEEKNSVGEVENDA
jgi:hypothetical protein